MILVERLGYALKNCHFTSVVLNPALMTSKMEKFVITAIPQADESKVHTFFSRFQAVGFHGTTVMRLGSQIDAGKFEIRKENPKIYFSTLDTATQYALRRSQADNSPPVIVLVSSQQKAKFNDIATEGHGMVGLGFYPYLTNAPDTPVKIVGAYSVEQEKKSS